MRVLVVEDQPKMQALLRQGLSEVGFAVDGAADGPEGLQAAAAGGYDVVVLDVMLPGFDGFEVLRRLRDENVRTPVLMLTARDSVPDRVRGLDSGADDYLVKPFAFDELVSRLRALLRRVDTSAPVSLRCGPLEVEPLSRTVTVSGTRVELSPREFSLLWMLMQRQGEVVSRAEILDHVWGGAADGQSNVVEVYVRYLRDKIDRPFGQRLIHTVRRSGYRLATTP